MRLNLSEALLGKIESIQHTTQKFAPPFL